MAGVTERVTYSDFCQSVMLNSTLHRESNNATYEQSLLNYGVPLHLYTHIAIKWVITILDLSAMDVIFKVANNWLPYI